MSPTPGRSTLMQSAPIYASNCVQVGPDCTWVKSRIFTPSSALPAWPHGFDDGRGTPLPECALLPCAFAAAFFGLSFTTFLADFFATALTRDFTFLLLAMCRSLTCRLLGCWCPAQSYSLFLFQRALRIEVADAAAFAAGARFDYA